ncbi:putative ATP-dependent zinc metallopeptidase, putative,metallo-peptidase, clan MA(E), family M41, partial [Trypanosoma cruzi]
DSLVERSVLFVLFMFLLSYVLYRLAQPSGKPTGWASLMKHADIIESIHLYQNYAQVYMEEAKVYLGLVDDQHTQEKLEMLRAACINAKVNKQQSKKEPNDGTNSAGFDVVMKGTPLAEHVLVGLGVFAWVIPFVFFPVFVMILSNSIGKSLAATVDAGKKSQKVKDMVFRVERTSNTRFHDIAGMKEPKKEITEVVDFLRQPERYTALGAKIPTGALLLGPPGTGKTLLAKAVAGESGVGFIPVCGSDFVELYVGMGALRVRQLFETAKKQRCIVYIDEIDAIGLKRSGAGHGEKQEQEHTLNELLTQLDGFSSGKRGDVMILASSNVAQEMLDPALIRPGRFDRIIHV